MATRMPSRDNLYDKLREVLGTNEATTLMELLPESQAQLATKTDVAVLRSDIDELGQRINGLDQRFKGLDQRIEGLDQRMEGLERRMDKFEDRLWDLHEALRAQTRIYITAMLGSMVGVGGMAFAAAALV